jgi:hypothetical protein
VSARIWRLFDVLVAFYVAVYVTNGEPSDYATWTWRTFAAIALLYGGWVRGFVAGHSYGVRAGVKTVERAELAAVQGAHSTLHGIQREIEAVQTLQRWRGKIPRA